REGKEVDAFARIGGAAGGDQHHRVAHADDDGAVGLLGELAGFNGETVPSDLDVTLLNVHWVLSARSRGPMPRPGPPPHLRTAEMLTGRGGRRPVPPRCRAGSARPHLLADAEFPDQFGVLVRVLALQ